MNIVGPPHYFLRPEENGVFGRGINLYDINVEIEKLS